MITPEHQMLLDRLEKLETRWRKIANDQGVRVFTGNDHALFANELAATIKLASRQREE